MLKDIMPHSLFRGKRIRYRDTKLITDRICLVWGLLFGIGFFVFAYYLYRLHEIYGTGILRGIRRIPAEYYVLWLVLVSAGTAVICALYRRFFSDRMMRLQHRQRIAEMVVKNGWYDIGKKQRKAYVKLPEFLRTDEKDEVLYFPKIYYVLDGSELKLTVEVATGSYQKQLMNLEEIMEAGLFCELISKELKRYYMEYVFLLDVQRNRISIEDVVVKDGKIRLMQNIWWTFDKLPHALIVGGTGGGKTYFILTIIEALLKSGASVSVLDPKRSDLADLAGYMPNVYFEQEAMMEELERFYDGMMERTLTIKDHPRYKTGKNYAYVGLEPHFLVFDEYVAFMEMVGRKREEVLTQMKKIIMLGRQVGYFIILACQRPDTKYFADGMRDQFHLRIALGKNSEMGYTMVFGSETKKEFFEKDIPGRGYITTGTGVIREFYSPLVPENYDFLKAIADMGLQPSGKEQDCEKELSDDFSSDAADQWYGV